MAHGWPCCPVGDCAARAAAVPRWKLDLDRFGVGVANSGRRGRSRTHDVGRLLELAAECRLRIQAKFVRLAQSCTLAFDFSGLSAGHAAHDRGCFIPTW